MALVWPLAVGMSASPVLRDYALLTRVRNQAFRLSFVWFPKRLYIGDDAPDACCDDPEQPGRIPCGGARARERCSRLGRRSAWLRLEHEGRSVRLLPGVH